MSVPLRQQITVAGYLLKQKLKGIKRYPLVLMLEPLFRCNLACAGCGKIDYPDEILNRRLSVEDCLAAVDECGAPIVSIAGGEPLLHKELPQVVDGIIARKKYVYLCTNALLLKKRMDDYTPSPYLTLSIHLDGNRDRHDASVCQAGVFDRAVEVIELAIKRGFRVTVNCTLFQGESAEEIAGFLDYVKSLGVEGVTIAPGFSYEHAPLQNIFIKMRESKELFRKVFKIGKGRKLAIEPLSALSGFPGRQPELQLHTLGQPDPQCIWLAEALLSAGGRRLRAGLQILDGGDPLAQIRQLEESQVRQLHGPLWL